jgi:hypothetical protein
MSLKSISKNIKEELSSQTEEYTQIDNRDFTGLKYDKLTLKNSISSFVSFIILSMVWIVLLLIPNNEGDLNIIFMFKANRFWAILLALLPIPMIYIGILGVFDRKPQLIIDNNIVFYVLFCQI